MYYDQHGNRDQIEELRSKPQISLLVVNQRGARAHAIIAGPVNWLTAQWEQQDCLHGADDGVVQRIDAMAAGGCVRMMYVKYHCYFQAHRRPGIGDGASHDESALIISIYASASHLNDCILMEERQELTNTPAPGNAPKTPIHFLLKGSHTHAFNFFPDQPVTHIPTAPEKPA